jgi:hypothetical protein
MCVFFNGRIVIVSYICSAFIRGLLENVGAEIDPIRLIRRIKNGLEIPGLKPALIKILQDFNLQISLLEGCQTILDGDCTVLVKKLNRDQTSGFFLSGKKIYPSRRGIYLMHPCRQDLVSHLFATFATNPSRSCIALSVSACGSCQVREWWRFITTSICIHII